MQLSNTPQRTVIERSSQTEEMFLSSAWSSSISRILRSGIAPLRRTAASSAQPYGPNSLPSRSSISSAGSAQTASGREGAIIAAAKPARPSPVI
eukprot:scaffold93186_cov75-Phaeocystis_antarctica.AAC.1